MSILKSTFDTNRCRHIADGMTLVLHCHHFASLTTQMANDCSLLDAKKLLAECAEDAFYKVLNDHYTQNKVTEISERIKIAEQYFSESGLGKISFTFAGYCAGEVELQYSHVDEGWLNKWGQSEVPVNHIGCGYVNAAFSAIFNRPERTYCSKEKQSIVRGAKTSVITVTDGADTGIE